MKKKLYQLVRKWGEVGDKLINKYYRSNNKYKLPITLLIICGLFVATYILSFILGSLVLFAPFLFTSIFFVCLIFPCIIILMGIIRKELNLHVWFAGVLSSILLVINGLCLAVFCNTITTLPHCIRTNIFSEEIQFPLGDPKGIAIDSKGTIYLAIQDYDRIQAYNTKGVFIKGWFLKTGGGYFDIWIEDDNLLHAVTVRPNKHNIFNLNGKLLKQTSIPSFNEYKLLLKQAGGLREQGKDGNDYLIRNVVWYSRVLKIIPDNSNSILIKDPYYLWMARAPIPALLYLAIGIAMCGFLISFTRKKVDFTEFSS